MQAVAFVSLRLEVADLEDRCLDEALEQHLEVLGVVGLRAELREVVGVAERARRRLSEAIQPRHGAARAVRCGHVLHRHLDERQLLEALGRRTPGARTHVSTRASRASAPGKLGRDGQSRRHLLEREGLESAELPCLPRAEIRLALLLDLSRRVASQRLHRRDATFEERVELVLEAVFRDEGGEAIALFGGIGNSEGRCAVLVGGVTPVDLDDVHQESRKRDRVERARVAPRDVFGGGDETADELLDDLDHLGLAALDLREGRWVGHPRRDLEELGELGRARRVRLDRREQVDRRCGRPGG